MVRRDQGLRHLTQAVGRRFQRRHRRAHGLEAFEEAWRALRESIEMIGEGLEVVGTGQVGGGGRHQVGAGAESRHHFGERGHFLAQRGDRVVRGCGRGGARSRAAARGLGRRTLPGRGHEAHTLIQDRARFYDGP